jgi:uncharacterized protein YbaR (Trm112 family)/ubiquinone/menaquinone biosynthesis C-methylase UbiE
MWSTLTDLLCCPLCRARLAVSNFNVAAHAHDPVGGFWVSSGVLLCAACKTWHPITHGVPVLLPYTTPAHEEFAEEHVRELQMRAPLHRPASGEPVRGEHLAIRSFSTEWLAYDFDGVIWEMDYADHERRFLSELGEYAPRKERPGRFLEVGCGLGLTTAMAQKNFGCEAIGVDLGAAALRAAAINRDNPRVHFVQASVYALPFAERTFETIYTRGVLHHTYSTREAFRALAPLGAPGGTMYVWVSGKKSIEDNLFRRTLYGAEVVARYVLSRSPDWISSLVLAPLAVSYMAFNRVRRLQNPRIQPYNYRRALHAARDRFTPEFAYRQDADEVSQWFREAGYGELQVVDWRAMPTADHDDYRRNTGVRGKRLAASNERFEEPLQASA